MTILNFRKPGEIRRDFPLTSKIMNNMFDGMLFNRFSSDGWDVFPKTNVIESKSEYILQIAVPGMEKDNFSISIEKDLMVLTVINDETSGEEINYLRREFDYASFKRNYNLPEEVDSERISASYENGILTIKLGKKDFAVVQPPKNIEIK